MSLRIKLLLRNQFPKQQLFLIWLGLQLALVLWCSTSAKAQGLGISGANLEGACPAACGIQIRITSTKLRERADGIDAVVDWTVEQRAPEIKLTSFTVTAIVEFNRLGKDEKKINVAPTQRQAVIRLNSGGFNKDIKFSDVTSVKAIVFATADAIAPLAITDIPSIKIVGQGNDAAVDVSWRTSGPLACSADKFVVNVKAVNEKGDQLDGSGEAATTARSLRVQLKGSLNKKGLRNPEATVKLRHSLIGCQQTTNFPPVLEPLGSGTGSNAPNPVVTLNPIRFSQDSGRIDMEAFWEVVEPSGFKATRFDLQFDLENANGAVNSVTRIASGDKRSQRGPQAQEGDLRSVTVTIKATFNNAANTAILTRQDKRTQPFTAKSTLPKAFPAAPQSSNIGLNVVGVKLDSDSAQHRVTPVWQVNIPANITVTSFEVEATASGNQSQAKRNAVVLGTARQATINFPVTELGNKLNKAQVKVTANGRRADGSTFQQTATGEGQPVAAPPPLPPPPVLLKINALNANFSGSNFIVNGAWIIELQAGITVQNFIVEATLLKPTGPTQKTVTVNAPVRQQLFTFTAAQASGATTAEMKVTANLRRADGTTFQETFTRQTKAGN